MEKAFKRHVQTNGPQIRGPSSGEEIPDDIRTEMIAGIGTDDGKYSMVTKYRRFVSLAPKTPNIRVSEDFKIINETILKALE
jgi:hypothetical protein